MRTLNKRILFLMTMMISLALLCASPVLAKKSDDECPGKSCEAYGQTKNKGGDEEDGAKPQAPGQAKRLVKGSSDIKGNLKTSQHIYYEGDTIEVSIKFSRGWEMLADGEVAAHVVVLTPDATVITVPVDPEIGPSDRRFFTVPLETAETLPVGQYQLGLIITVPDGDPTNLSDWYNGFRGLTDMEGVLISEEFLSEDSDMDGECDFDEDGDGFCDETGSDDDDDEDDDDESEN